MTISEMDLNSESIRGLRVECQDCWDSKETALWKCFYLVIREHGKQTPKWQKDLAYDIAKMHDNETNHKHRIVIFNLKKIGVRV